MTVDELVRLKALEIANKHADVIEQHCIEMCKRYNCTAKDLVIKYKTISNVEIHLEGIRCVIESRFIIDGEGNINETDSI